MKKTTLICLLLACSSSLSINTGCSKRGAEALVGTWAADDGERIQFLKDGSFTITNLPPNRVTGSRFVSEVKGTYTVVAPAQLTLETTTPSGKVSSVCQFSLTPSALTLQDGKETRKFQRAGN